MYGRFYGLREFKYATRIFKVVERVAMATKFKQKLAKIAQISIPCKKSKNFKQVNTGLLNSSMLPEFSTEQKESPWQPKLCRNKPNFRRIQFSKSYGDIVCVYGRVFDVGEFKYANKNFRGAKGVAIATKSQAAQERCTVVRPMQKSIGKWEIRPPVKS